MSFYVSVYMSWESLGMRISAIGASLLALSLSGCLSVSTSTVEGKVSDNAVKVEACPVVEPPQCPVQETPEAPVSQFHTIGEVEYVDILPTGMRQKARIDTGAETTSIDARDVQPYERDGKAWVKFTVVDRNSNQPKHFKLPVERTVLIKRHGADNVRRRVVSMQLAIGELRDSVEVTLADREKFEYPVLIGRNFLEGRAVVDVSRKYIALER